MAWVKVGKFDWNVSWSSLTGVPAFATRWPTWDEVTGKPSIPQGTVTSVSAGAGMSFSTITGSGEVALGQPAQVSPTSVSEVTSNSHSHSFSSLFSDTTAFTADHTPDQYPSSVVSLSRVGSLADTGWPTNGVAANFMAYGNRYGQLYFSSNSNQVWFRTGADSWRSFEELWHSGNFDPATKADDNAVVKTSGNQSNLSGNKSWTGTHEFVGSAVTPIQVVRNNSNVNSLIRYTTNRGSVWAGYGNTGRNAVDHFAIGGSNNLTGGDLWFSVDSTGAYIGAEEVYHTGNQLNIGTTAASARSALGLGSAATSNTSNFASSTNFNYIGSISGGSYYDYLPSNNGVSYLFHAAGNSPADAPASPARQTAVLGMDTTWGTAQLAITNEDTPQVFVRGNGATPWNRVWTAGDFDPSSKADTSRSISAGNGLIGGGNLTSNRTISLGTPGTITATSTNSVSDSSHTHSLDTSGNFTWNGNHIFVGDMIARSGSASSQMTVQRTGNSINAAIAYTTTGGTVYAGQGDSGYFNWGSGTDLRLSNNNSWGRIGSSGLEIKGTISDSIGNVRKPEYRTANGTITLASSDVNRIVEKSNNSSYTYTIPSGHGSHGDIITFVNSGTSGTLTINAPSGVTIYRNGTSGNISVGPGSTVTVYRSATANRWIA